MAQSALTVTPPNPTPPTNMSCVGVTGPNPPNYTRQTYAGAFANPVTNPPPFYDDAAGGVATTQPQAFSINTAALASGTSAADNNTGSTPGTVVTAAGGTGFNSVVGTYPVQGGLVPAATSAAHEGAGLETPYTKADYNPNVFVPFPMITVGVSPALPADAVGGRVISPNQSHASSLSPPFGSNPTLSTISPTTSVHGTAAITMTATGVGFNRQSKIVIGGVPQNTTFVSSTSLTCLATPAAAAGAVPVTVVTGGVVTTTAQTWTIS